MCTKDDFKLLMTNKKTIHSGPTNISYRGEKAQKITRINT